jgi:hypothetical protein
MFAVSASSAVCAAPTVAATRGRSASARAAPARLHQKAALGGAKVTMGRGAVAASKRGSLKCSALMVGPGSWGLHSTTSQLNLNRF